MKIIRKNSRLKACLAKMRDAGCSIGFVPTMGALHAGHISLIEKAVANSDICVCSIFVNPAQFNDPADFQNYPVTIPSDIDKLFEAGCDIIFLPSAEEIYPQGWENLENYPLGDLEDRLEGAYRKGHFQGVAQVLNRLFAIIVPDHIYMGQKDYQQCKIVAKILRIGGHTGRLIEVPTVRAADGLALSSRNLRLTPEQRRQATALNQVLKKLRNKLRAGDPTAVLAGGRGELLDKGFSVDYLQLADAKELVPIKNWDAKTDAILLVAAWLGAIRLIDNLPVYGDDQG